MPITLDNQSKGNNFTLHKLRRNLLVSLGLTEDPVVKVYNGYGNNEKLTVYGHVFSLSPLPGKKYTTNILRNALTLLRLFMVRPMGGAHVRLHWDGMVHEACSEDDGFFRIEWQPVKGIIAPLTKLGTDVATVALRFVPNSSAATVTNKAQYPLAKPKQMHTP